MVDDLSQVTQLSLEVNTLGQSSQLPEIEPLFSSVEVCQTEDVLGDGNEQIDKPVDHIQIYILVEVCQTQVELGDGNEQIDKPVDHIQIDNPVEVCHTEDELGDGNEEIDKTC